MTNEELAVLIQKGDDSLIPQLWEQIQKWARVNADRVGYVIRYKAYVDADDLYQVCFFAMLEAVKTFDPEKCKFLTWYDYYVKSAFEAATGRRTAHDREAPHNKAFSYDAPVNGTVDLYRSDVLPDKSIDLLHNEFLKELHSVVASCLSSIKPEYQEIIRLIYFEGMSDKEAAAALGCTEKKVYSLEQGALRALRHPAISKRLAPYYLSRTIYENVW